MVFINGGGVFATKFPFWKYGVDRCFRFYVLCQYRVDLVDKALQIPALVSEVYIKTKIKEEVAMAMAVAVAVAMVVVLMVVYCSGYIILL